MKADEAIGDPDPDDGLYLECAIARDAIIWSADSDFDEHQLVETVSRGDAIDSVEMS